MILIPIKIRKSIKNSAVGKNYDYICNYLPVQTILKQTTALLLLVFYTFGTICLPAGDFSMFTDLPAMYRHCKSNEDKDMTPIDFITDHLVNIDGIFDKHINGDEQRPHSPIQSQHHFQVQAVVLNYFSFSLNQIHPVKVAPVILSEKFLPSDYFSKIFHPPII